MFFFFLPLPPAKAGLVLLRITVIMVTDKP